MKSIKLPLSCYAKYITKAIFIIWLLAPLRAPAQSIANDSIYKVAAANLSTVFLDKEKSLEKALNAIKEASDKNADLIVFPEVFLAGYPAWSGYLNPQIDREEANELYVELLNNSVTVPGMETDLLCKAAKDGNMNIVIGVHERNSATGGSIFNTILFISSEGELLGKHQKLIPTYNERLVWARGDESTFSAFDTPVGKIGGLICWENQMPLARTALYQMGIQILVSPTADSRENWLVTMQNAALEGGVYVISVCAPEPKNWVPEKYRGYTFKKQKSKKDAEARAKGYFSGNSSIISPYGKILAGPIKEEKIIYAEIDLKETLRAKQVFDAAGHYARPDVFKLTFTGNE